MRHRNKGRALSRQRDHRKAMMNNMAISIFEYGFIKTTLAKAKELRMFVEPLVTISKLDNVSNRRLLKAKLNNNKKILGRIFKIGFIFRHRLGGYLRILKCGYRKGDAAPMAIVEFVQHISN